MIFSVIGLGGTQHATGGGIAGRQLWHSPNLFNPWVSTTSPGLDQERFFQWQDAPKNHNFPAHLRHENFKVPCRFCIKEHVPDSWATQKETGDVVFCGKSWGKWGGARWCVKCHAFYSTYCGLVKASGRAFLNATDPNPLNLAVASPKTWGGPPTKISFWETFHDQEKLAWWPNQTYRNNPLVQVEFFNQDKPFSRIEKSIQRYQDIVEVKICVPPPTGIALL